MVVPSTSAPAGESKAPPVVGPDATELVEPSLDGIVAHNLRLARAARGLSLDELSREAGVSRTLLGQIELGRTPASIGVVWKIAQAMGVPFSALLSTMPVNGSTVSTREGAKRLLSADGRFSSRALFALGDPTAAEFYELRLAPHSREDAEAHRPGTRENLVVSAGRLELKVGAESFLLGTGDAINFAADRPHSYINASHEECWMYLVMNYSDEVRRLR
ncbi:MAG: helix-turn-helix transcriptional regulator [Myxococcales bacterium]|nr:helix-turn-helix transcriptional regulator [Myxococcales bacterium]